MVVDVVVVAAAAAFYVDISHKVMELPSVKTFAAQIPCC